MKVFGRQYEAQRAAEAAPTHIDRDEGITSLWNVEPWTCTNPLCGTAWTNKPETWDCAGAHGITLCEECKASCASCGQVFCGACLTTVDYGEGPERNCRACWDDSNAIMDHCTSCNEPRVDLKEYDFGTSSETGYSDSGNLCSECRGPRNAA